MGTDEQGRKGRIAALRDHLFGSKEPGRKDPDSPEEWQEAVDVAHVMLHIESARQYGLVRGGPVIDVDRCEQILELGELLGYTPAEDAIERLLSTGAA